MLFRDVIKDAIEVLEKENISDAVNDAWLLSEFELGINHQKYYMDMNMTIDDEQRKRYMELVSKRAEHIPLQHITGHQEFMGFDFLVNEHVLIPRQDTELLVEKAIEIIESEMLLNNSDDGIKNAHDRVSGIDRLRVLDMCTGSGCIAISVKKICEQKNMDIEMTAADISEKALETANKNAKINDAEVTFIQSDLFENIDGDFDIILSNPPYIPTKVIEGLEVEVKEHEPFNALDGLEDGLHFYRLITEEASKRIKKGYIIYEIGYDQANAVSDILRNIASCVKVYKDLADNDRVVVAKI
ncbi:MAG: peptide chain release factor N(5)-glutamine methyltransferase [Lachnospiraceae bacterium]|nr:peptide chain release factor N(5)-glutamine methyltransferase [Lachnospiraceae bacterium]